MLSDRNYMNNGGNQQQRYAGQENPNMCIYVLIAINAIVFLSIDQNLDLFNRLALSSIGIKLHMYWQIVTSMFMHGSFMHILFNMWGLYLLGTLIMPYLKPTRFLTMYFISGICGSLLWLTFNWKSIAYIEQIIASKTMYVLLNVVGFDVSTTSIKVLGTGGMISTMPFADIIPANAIGASGALFGVLIATAMLEPNREFILLFLPKPMKTKTLLWVALIIPILFELFGIRIAHSAHIGGMIGGYIYMRIFCSKMIIWDPVSVLFQKIKFGGRKTNSKGWTVKTAPLHFKTKPKFDFENKDPETPVTQKELDHLLDKVSRQGINSLSDVEMATLRKAREQMRKR